MYNAMDHEQRAASRALITIDARSEVRGAGHESVDAILSKIVHLAVQRLDGCDYAGISLVERRKITSPASTGGFSKAVGRIQEVVGEGPSLDVIKECSVVQTDDLAAEDRWPEFSTRAHQSTGVRSILSLRLHVEKYPMGALNLYSTELGAFEDTDMAVAWEFAAHAAASLQSARRAQTAPDRQGAC